MKINKLSLLVISVSLLFIGAVFAAEGSQEDTVATQPASQEIAVPQNPATIMPPSESETQWVWGEVLSIDPAAKSLTVKYLDYETDQEKDMVIGTDEKTTYENIKSIDEIKPKDTLSIDYIVGAEGKNTAKNISLEKPESAAAPQETPNGETSTENTQTETPPHSNK
ncbi:MAG: hypothetical protein ABSE81_02350 [Candidatus Omnitrophota bacterium]|jgi:hypothetical protein